MDHFIGFDHLLRICLGRNQHIALFGPSGFLKNVESKLGAYTWNLVKNYTNDFELAVTELSESFRTTRKYRCQNGFVAEDETIMTVSNSEIIDHPTYVVRAAFLDHKIPSLAFSFEEKTRLNVKKNVLQAMGLRPGPWITGFKDQIIRHEPDWTPVPIWWKNADGMRQETKLPLGLLSEKAVKISTGRKVCYITDAIWNRQNIDKMLRLAHGSELLFIEAPFLDKDVKTAEDKYHLTARQAGTLASMAEVKRFILFHYSPKYRGVEALLNEEAFAAFQQAKTAL
jgi:ribonuclease Z